MKMNNFSMENFLECIPERDVGDVEVPAFSVSWAECGNFTVVVIRQKGSGELFTGVSKRCPTDTKSDTGLCTASTRAWREFIGKDPGYGRQRPVSKAGARRASFTDRFKRAVAFLHV